MLKAHIAVMDATPDLSEQVERVTAALRPSPRVRWYADFDALDASIDVDGPFDVLIAGPQTASESGLRRLRETKTRLGSTAVILAFDQPRRGSMRDTVRTGAVDLIRLPVTDAALLESVEQALEIVPAVTPASAPAAPPSRGADGTVITVVSATGGCGKTFFATNLAYRLQSHHGKRTCVLDLDLQFGELSTALRLKPAHTITDLLSGGTEGEAIGTRLEEHLEKHESGIYVLAAPKEPAEADHIEGTDIARIITEARARFDYVVIDTPSAISDPVLVAIDHADQIFAMATLDLPSVRNLGVMLSTFKQLKVPADRVKLLLNKVETDVGIDVARVERYFPQGFSMIIPYGREVNRSINMGTPVLAFAPRCDVSKALTSGMAASVVVERTAEPAAEVAGARPRRWLRRRGPQPA